MATSVARDSVQTPEHLRHILQEDISFLVQKFHGRRGVIHARRGVPVGGFKIDWLEDVFYNPAKILGCAQAKASHGRKKLCSQGPTIAHLLPNKMTETTNTINRDARRPANIVGMRQDTKRLKPHRQLWTTDSAAEKITAFAAGEFMDSISKKNPQNPAIAQVVAGMKFHAVILNTERLGYATVFQFLKFIIANVFKNQPLLFVRILAQADDDEIRVVVGSKDIAEFVDDPARKTVVTTQWTEEAVMAFEGAVTAVDKIFLPAVCRPCEDAGRRSVVVPSILLSPIVSE